MDPIDCVDLRGEPRGMGRAQGERLRGEIGAARRTLLGLEAFRMLRPWWMPMGLFEAVARRRARALIEAPLRRDYAAQAEFLEGLAEGSGQSGGTLLMLAAGEILLSKIDVRDAPPTASCCALGLRAPGGTILHKNFDYPSSLQPFYVVRRCRPARGYATLEFTVAPLAGTVDGLNERGLALTYDYAFCTDPVRANVPLTVVLNELLRSCATVKEALDFLATRPRSGGAMLMMADLEGDLASVELSNGAMALRRADPDARGLSHANHYRMAETMRVEVPRSSLYSEKNVRALRGVPVHESSLARGARLDERVAGTEEGDEAATWRWMSDHGGGASGGDFTVCRHGPYWETTASIQILPARRVMRVIRGRPCDGQPSEFAL